MIRFIGLLLLVMSALRLDAPALAHEAMSGWRYPASCCSDRDCAEIRAEAVTATLDGYVVIVRPGEHPMWPVGRPEPLVLGVPYLDSRLSPDGHHHLCIDGSGRMLCFFAAHGGS